MAPSCILCICLRKNYCCFLTPLQVSQQFAECISLPDRTAVQVRAISNVAKATLVTIEPHSEDDWEVLELNSEHAEAAILNQVLFFCYVNLLFQFPCCPIKSAQFFCCVQPFIMCVCACSSIYILIGKFHMHSMGLEPTTSPFIQLSWEEVPIKLQLIRVCVCINTYSFFNLPFESYSLRNGSTMFPFFYLFLFS